MLKLILRWNRHYEKSLFAYNKFDIARIEDVEYLTNLSESV